MDKIKEALKYIICVAIIIAVAYYTGVLKGFTPNDFKDAITNLTNTAAGAAGSSSIAEYLKSDRKGTAIVSSSGVTEYKAILIPKKVMLGSETSEAWENVIFPDKKAVFYVYDDYSGDKKYDMDYHKKVQNYIYSNKAVKEAYRFEMVSLIHFNAYMTGGPGMDKMCDSLQECKAVRDKAANYSLLAQFLQRCGRTMCIINPNTNQYVVLKNRNADDAINMMNSLKNW